MSCEYKYRGRIVTPEDVAFIRQLVTENPAASRRALSEVLAMSGASDAEQAALRDSLPALAADSPETPVAVRASDVQELLSQLRIRFVVPAPEGRPRGRLGLANQDLRRLR